MALLVSDVPETSITQLLSNVKGNFKQIKNHLERFDIECISHSLNLQIDCSHQKYLQYPSINGQELIASYEYFRPSTSVTKSSYNNGLKFRLKYSTPIWTDIMTQLYPDCKDKNYVYLSYNPSKHDPSIFVENIENEKENFVREMMNNIEKVIGLQDTIREATNEKEEEYDTELPLTNEIFYTIREAKNEKEEQYDTDLPLTNEDYSEPLPNQKDIPMEPLTNEDYSDHPFGSSPIDIFDFINWNSWTTEPDPLSY
eukprot:439620_1